MMPPAKFRKGTDTAVNSEGFCPNSQDPKALGRVLVLGAGAVGLSFAGKISEVCEVYVVCRERHSAAIKKRGLFMEGVWGERRVTGMAVFSSFAELSAAIAAKEAGYKQCGSCDTGGTCGNAERFGFDYIFITSKSSDTWDICREYSSLFAGAVLVSLQNGIGNEEILQSYAAEINAVAQNPADRLHAGGNVSLHAPCAVFGATITTNFRSPADGCVMVMSESEPLKIGVYPSNLTADAGSLRRLSEIVSLIRQSGIKVESAESIRSAIWEKSLLNIAVNPLTALFQTRVGSVSDENLRAVIAGIIAETFEVIAAEGVEIRWKSAGEYLDYLFTYLVPSFSAVYTSMCQDLAYGRHSEIDSINGAVVRLGGIHGIKTPYNESICRLIRFIDGKNDAKKKESR